MRMVGDGAGFGLSEQVNESIWPQAAITKNRPGESAGIARQDLPEVRIRNHAGSGQAGGF